MNVGLSGTFQEEIVYAAPPDPLFWPEGILEGRGVVYFEAPRGRNSIRLPSFIHSPTLEAYFQGGGGICVKQVPSVKLLF